MIYLTEHEKAEHVRICKENPKLLNDEGSHLIRKIITGDVHKHTIF